MNEPTDKEIMTTIKYLDNAPIPQKDRVVKLHLIDWGKPLRDRYIRRVCKRCGNKRGILTRLGKLFGISRERVRQIKEEDK